MLMCFNIKSTLIRSLIEFKIQTLTLPLYAHIKHGKQYRNVRSTQKALRVFTIKVNVIFSFLSFFSLHNRISIKNVASHSFIHPLFRFSLKQRSKNRKENICLYLLLHGSILNNSSRPIFLAFTKKIKTMSASLLETT